MPRHEFDMGAIELARAIADPEHMGGGIVPIAARGILTRVIACS